MNTAFEAERLRDARLLERARTAARREQSFAGRSSPFASATLMMPRKRITKSNPSADPSELVQVVVAEGAVGEDRYANASGHDLFEALQERVLVLVPPALEIRLRDGPA
jgi:hypothetical protein